ncbi:MAG: hypothetical protein GYB68_15485 [Chloroflexi bacterium]|nr:hypothetical protein [Chloroflexota bacterium]
MSTQDLVEESILEIRQMHVIWRHSFMLRALPDDFLSLAQGWLAELPSSIAVSGANSLPPLLSAIERASIGAANGGHQTVLRAQLQNVRLVNLPRSGGRNRFTLSPQALVDVYLDEIESPTWIEVAPVLALHRSGVGLLEFYASYHHERGQRPFRRLTHAIHYVRSGIYRQVLLMPEGWVKLMQDHQPTRVGGDDYAQVGELLDLSYSVLYDLQAKTHAGLSRAQAKNVLPIDKPITRSATVILAETAPMAGDRFEPFVMEFGAQLRGVGAMDLHYEERAFWLIDEELSHNLSIDSELALFLLGNSELLLFNEQILDLRPGWQRRGSEPDVLAAYVRYVILIQWVYIQKTIAQLYLARLDELAGQRPPRRQQVIQVLQGALGDLVHYQDDITGFATNIRFLEEMRAHHNLPDFEDRIEAKQSLLLNYTSENHDFREAQAAEILNWLVGILAGVELADIVAQGVGLSPDIQPTYGIITVSSIILTFAFLAFLSYIRYRRRRN